jgi:hypothetical protein
MGAEHPTAALADGCYAGVPFLGMPADNLFEDAQSTVTVIGVELRVYTPDGGQQRIEAAMFPCNIRLPRPGGPFGRWGFDVTVHTSDGDQTSQRF